MSRLALPGGDDHPEAAQKHLLDAQALLAQRRPDGAAYLSGYVVECALKTVVQLETGVARRGHVLASLAREVATAAAMAGAKTARYLGPATRNLLTAAIAAWTVSMRYRAPAMALPEAETWVQSAQAVFGETVGQMRLDGVL